MAIRLLTLDLDNTLWAVEPIIVEAEAAMYSWIEQNCPGTSQLYSPEGLRQYKAELAECYPSMRHQISKLRYETLRRAFMQAGVSHDEAVALAGEAFAVFHQARNRVTFFDDALQTLEDLNKDLALIAVSNGNADLKMIGIHHLFDHHFNAENVGAAKPSPDMFHAALNAAGVAAHESIHIGDHPVEDIATAATLGMKTIWVNFDERVWPLDHVCADAEITHWSQLALQIERLADR
ncbi:HAD-IA family hydrolase [Thalassolituus sp.]|jgi:putative hydrolase of the HAD superfamily|uniref:HAD family hydrolase n=1 Tax=Thalassolituus sp. TaxID=2030822 RepID=UPI0032D99958